jgi:hypothetical protein
MIPSLGLPKTEHIKNLYEVWMQQPEIVAIPPRMDVPGRIKFIPNCSHVSELVPTNGGTVVTWVSSDTVEPALLVLAVFVAPLADRSRGGVFATTRAVSANNRQKIVAHKHAIKGIRVFPS